MKKVLFLLLILCTMCVCGAFSYVYYVHIPNTIEARMRTGFAQLGFDDVLVQSVQRKSGIVVFTGISLGAETFTTLDRMEAHVSLMGYLFNPERSVSLEVSNLQMIGEINKDYKITLAGVRSRDAFMKALAQLPVYKILIKDSHIHLMSETIGGVSLDYNAELNFDQYNKIQIRSYVDSQQKRISLHARVDGFIDASGHFNFDIDAENMAMEHGFLSLKRGSASLVYSSQSGSENVSPPLSSLNGDVQFSSVRFYDMPLSTVRGTLKQQASVYSFIAEGTTFGPENIVWTSEVIKDEDSMRSEISLYPNSIAFFLAFLKRNGLVKKDISFPPFVMGVAAKSVIIKTEQRDGFDTKGTVHALLAPFDLHFSSDFSVNEDGEIGAQYSILENDFRVPSDGSAHSDTTEGAVVVRGDEGLSFKASSLGMFNLNPQNSSGYTVDWEFETAVSDGKIHYGVFDIPYIQGKMNYSSQAYNAVEDNETVAYQSIPFRLPFKDEVKYEGRLYLDFSASNQEMLRGLDVQIYGGSIVTQNPVLEAGELTLANVLQVSDINLSTLFKDAGFSDIEVTGEMGGIIPFRIKGVDGGHEMDVNGGILQSQGTGVIRLPDDKIASLFPGDAYKIRRIRAALKNYHYEYFEIRLDGDLSGRIMMTLHARGFNPDMISKQPIDLNLQIETQISLLFDTLLKVDTKH